MSQAHSKFPVHPGEPYGQLPFETGGTPRGEMYLDVTAETAADFLAHSRGGRRVRDADVRELAREMRAGDYSAEARGKPFKFDDKGYLRDGHHTAYAVIEAAQDAADPGGSMIPEISPVRAEIV